MDVSAVNSNLNFKSLFDKDMTVSDDVFSELFSAVFSNFFLNQNFQTEVSNSDINIENVKNLPLELNLNDLSAMNIAADLIKNSIISSNGSVNKDNADELDLILKELGISKEDIDSRIPLIIDSLKQCDENKMNKIDENTKASLEDIKNKSIEDVKTQYIIKDEKAADDIIDVHKNEIKENTVNIKLKSEPQHEENEANLKKTKDEYKTDKINMQTENHVSRIKEAVLQKAEDKNIPYIKNNEDLIEAVVEKFKTLRVPGFTQLKLKLMPENLGEITVKVVLEKGQINGNIIADKKDTANIIMGNIETLKTELKNSNVNFNNISVNIASDENYNEQRNHSSFNNFNGNKKSQENFSEFKVEDNNEKEDGFSIIA
ncbi:hook-length control protein FliK [Caloramator quimbayensis]|uniref:Hook-length control protein FliK n=1 Tax=Caloramator quimbayensis TaxID=1147123 RepID=A0A1T4X9U0_9CLOT|nr:flagellar hook-length control protein FliK [Caloramator quimbayensis]SKA86372.1 hook-length control protein FliK [Caloramator quimbayensis]